MGQVGGGVDINIMAGFARNHQANSWRVGPDRGQGGCWRGDDREDHLVAAAARVVDPPPVARTVKSKALGQAGESAGHRRCPGIGDDDEGRPNGQVVGREKLQGAGQGHGAATAAEADLVVLRAGGSAVDFYLERGAGSERVIAFNLYDAEGCARSMNAVVDGYVVADGPVALEDAALDQDGAAEAAVKDERAIADGGGPCVGVRARKGETSLLPSWPGSSRFPSG